MKELDVQQDSEAWHSERNKRIGASDVPIILGLSPYKTATQLWEEKLGLREKQASTFAMERGKRLEVVARQILKVEMGIYFEPKVFVDEHQDYLMASLDGYTIHNNHKIIWENKAPKISEHLVTPNGPPEKYYPQIQTQLMVSQADYCFFTTIVEQNDGHEVLHCVVIPDKALFEVIREETAQFYECIKKKKPPKLKPNDLEIITDIKMIGMAVQYENLLKDKREIEGKLEFLKVKMLENVRHNKATCRNLRFSKSDGKSTVDYKAIPQLKDIDLKPYTKTGKPYYSIRVID